MPIIRLTVSVVTKPQFETISDQAAQRDSLPHVLSSKAVSFRCKVNAHDSDTIQAVENQALSVYENVAQVTANSLGIYDESFSYLQSDESVKFSAEPKNNLYLIIDRISRNPAKRKEPEAHDGTCVGNNAKISSRAPRAIAESNAKRRKPATPASSQSIRKVSASPASQSTPSKPVNRASTRESSSGSRLDTPEPLDLNPDLSRNTVESYKPSRAQYPPDELHESSRVPPDTALAIDNTTQHDMSKTPETPHETPQVQGRTSTTAVKKAPTRSKNKSVAASTKPDASEYQPPTDSSSEHTEAHDTRPKEELVKRRTRKIAALKDQNMNAEDAVAVQDATKTYVSAGNTATNSMEWPSHGIRSEGHPEGKTNFALKSLIVENNKSQNATAVPKSTATKMVSSERESERAYSNKALKTKEKPLVMKKDSNSSLEISNAKIGSAATASKSPRAQAIKNNAQKEPVQIASSTNGNSSHVSASNMTTQHNGGMEESNSSDEEIENESESEDEQEKSRRQQRAERARIVSASRRESSLPPLESQSKAASSATSKRQKKLLSTSVQKAAPEEKAASSVNRGRKTDDTDHVPGSGGFELLSKYQPDVHDSRRPVSTTSSANFQSSDEESEDSSGDSSESASSSDSVDNHDSKRMPRKRTSKHLYA